MEEKIRNSVNILPFELGGGGWMDNGDMLRKTDNGSASVYSLTRFPFACRAVMFPKQKQLGVYNDCKAKNC